jgi:hypothetical protein
MAQPSRHVPGRALAAHATAEDRSLWRACFLALGRHSADAGSNDQPTPTPRPSPEGPAARSASMRQRARERITRQAQASARRRERRSSTPDARSAPIRVMTCRYAWWR